MGNILNQVERQRSAKEAAVHDQASDDVVQQGKMFAPNALCILLPGYDSAFRYAAFISVIFGVEWQSNYSLEIVYEVVDERYKSGKSLIVTTNLTLENLQNPRTIPKIEEKYIMDYKRIYDCILEMCVPVFFPVLPPQKGCGR